MSLRLLLLSTDATLPSRCLHVDANGVVLESVEVAPMQPLPQTFAPGASRNVVVVPGTEVRALWLDLPAHNPIQALAAAKLLLEEHLAGPVEALHIAIAPRQQAGARLVVAVERASLEDWLQRAATLGLAADAVVPDHLALAAPDGDGGDARAADMAACLVCILEGRWIVRGREMAFSAEAGLAQQVLGESRYQLIEDREAVALLLAGGAGHAPIDLLQYEFAREQGTRSDRPSRRRLALLALALLLSPVMLLLAESVRYGIAKRALDRQAAAIAAPLVPDASGDAVAALQARQRALELPHSMDNLRRSLFEAVAATAGTRLDSFEYAEAEASASVVHANPTQVQDLRTLLEQSGIRTQDGGSAPVADGLRTQLMFEASSRLK